MSDGETNDMKQPVGLAGQAKRAGVSPLAFARDHKGDKGSTGEAARAYLNNVRRMAPQGTRSS